MSNNSALRGGAIYLEKIQFCDNRGSWGGAMYLVYGTLYINSNKSVEFIMNRFKVGQFILSRVIASPLMPPVNYSAKLTTQHFKEVLSMSHHHHYNKIRVSISYSVCQ